MRPTVPRLLLRPSLLLAAGLATTLPPVAAAQSVLRVPGKTVEVVGLNRWTIPMLQDSLARYAPGTSLDSHACAAVLRYTLGFADAAAFSFAMQGDSLERVVVVVVEPQDSARVRYRAAALDTTRARPEWGEAVAAIRARPGLLQQALYGYHARHEPIPARLKRDSAQLAGIWRFLEARRAPEDARLARETLLAPDPGVYNRMVAAAILINFPESDSTWWTLVETMRETDGGAKGVAGLVLAQLSRRSPRAVDWAPVAPAIHAMLDGTSLFQLSDLMGVLAQTRVSPELARPLLAGGGRMLLSYLGAEHDMLKHSAHRLLVALNGGRDLGRDVPRWRAWVEGL